MIINNFNIKFILISFFLIYSNYMQAQNLIIEGKIIDFNTNKPIDRATIMGINNGTITDIEGNFKIVVNKVDFIQKGIIISCVGYEPIYVKKTEKLNQVYKLIPKQISLQEIRFIDPGLSIIKKAIAKISENYPQKNYLIEGFLRIYHLSTDSLKQKTFYKNDAIIKIEHPAYDSKNLPIKTMLLKNKYENGNTFEISDDTMRRVNGYLIVNDGDLVYKRKGFLNINNLKNFDFNLLDDKIYNNRLTYLIRYKEKRKNGEYGIIYIDVKTYGIVKINNQKFDIYKFPMAKIDYESIKVEYKLINNKWQLDDLKINLGGKYNNFFYSTLKEYKTISIDSTTDFVIPYKKLIQNLSETISLNEILSLTDLPSFTKLVDSLETNSYITRLDLPDIKAINTETKKVDYAHKFLNYYSKNLKLQFQIGKLPYTLFGFQPVVNQNINSINEYTFYSNAQLRIYKPIYFEWGNYRNFGVGGLNSNISSYSLDYDFFFNKKGHPIFLTPSIGYSVTNITKRKENFYNQKNIFLGLNIAYERSHLLSYVFSLKYFEPLNASNKGLNINQYRLLPSIGIQLKLN